MKITSNTFPLLLFMLSIPWFYLMNTLMIADVWDESNFFLALQIPPFSELSLFESIKYVWTHQISIYRPLPMSMAFILNEVLGSNFVYFRIFNILLLIVSLYLLSQSLMNFFALSFSRVTLFYLFSLYSSAVLITGGWFANIFDALSLFFISGGIFLLSKDKLIPAALLIGLSFFCKEISILVIPFLGFILYQKKTDYKKLIIAMMIIVFFGVLYAYLRQMLIPLGSSSDLHGFQVEAFFPSLLAFLEGFWWQHTKFSQNSLDAWLGLLVFILSIAAVKGYIAKLSAGFIVVLAALAYWNMFSYQQDVIVNSVNFIGRLYLIPSILVLYIISIKANKAVFFVIGLLILSGTIKTYTDHRLFQTVYFEIYQLAKQQSEPLFVHYPDKVLSDKFRNIYIGHYPDSKLKIDTERAKLLRL